ncbi:RNA polymerase sigma factor [Streptomyces sp. NBC_01429]|uniref:RNA polymerase sigma factor n=1 Tax=Streptomyces sp. NBC_01429 TaxID=2903862 RepID=UPI002E2C900D|nr:sigma-70 family RNA polymerase sigma factor [Streptomyces sp. NBC_01429]
MRVHNQPGPDVVSAARAGDQRAVDALITGYLPLIYNIVGRALDGHADVDDVVQETMLRVLNGLAGLEDPRRFRSWAVAIAMNQIRERWRARSAGAVPGPLDETPETADPGADFVDLTILELRLSGQRREVAEATRWLEAEERELLSLWWLETAGQLTRAETTESLGLPGHHVAVRVQRMKARLEAARLVVRALGARPRCDDLVLLTVDWDGVPGALWRKRLARHVRECPRCAVQQSELLPAEGLLARLALLPLPVALAVRDLLPGAIGTGAAGAGASTAGTGTGAVGAGAHTAGAHTAGAPTAGAHGAAASGTSVPAGSAGSATLAAKPAALLAAGVLALGGGAALVYQAPWEGGEHRATPAPASSPATDRVTRGSASPSLSPSLVAVASSPAATSRPKPSTSASASAAASPAGGTYGTAVDRPDPAPRPDARPAPLPRRAGSGVTMTSFPGKVSGENGYQIVHRGEWVTIRGTGYFTVRWDLMYMERPGGLTMPSWTGLRGELFHVASGGGHRMDDAQPGTPSGHTWQGNPDEGSIDLPSGAQVMWRDEYFHLDGEVTVHLNETDADYNLDVLPMSWDAVSADLTRPPASDGADGRVRYGFVRDTGDDGAPVPQYLTRETPADPLTVRQQSTVQ